MQSLTAIRRKVEQLSDATVRRCDRPHVEPETFHVHKKLGDPTPYPPPTAPRSCACGAPIRFNRLIHVHVRTQRIEA